MNLSNTISYKTLHSIKIADKFNLWMYQTIKKYLSGNILEIGSGIGNISRFCLEEGHELTLSDINKDFLSILKNQFSHLPNTKDFIEIDLAEKNFEERFFHLKESFDSIFLLNVLEHIYDDATAIKNCHYLLKHGGNLVILVPAYQSLYSEFDKKIGHYKRYTVNTLKLLFPSTLFTIENHHYFNALGISGWLWNKVFKKKEITSNKMAIYNKLVPIAKLLDRIVAHKIGLSAIIVSRKN